MSKECTTHHFACDCREEKFKELERENAALREALDILTHVIGLTPIAGNKAALQEAFDMARAALRKESQP